MLLDCQYNDGTAKLKFDECELFITCDHDAHTAPVVYDFVLFAAVIIGMTKGVDIELNLPVSRCAYDNITKLQRAFSCWRLRNVRECKIKCFNIVENHTFSNIQPFNATCLSGGIDSIHALLTNQARMKITHGLLVHGVNYRLHETKGFGELYERVSRICRKAGIEPIVVKTNFLKFPFRRNIFYLIVFAMAMHYLGRNFSSVAIASDYTLYQDFIRFPYCSNKFIGDLLSGAVTKVEYCGYELDRLEKAEKIIADGRFVEDLSVCNTDTSTGGNCGKCAKCIRTRLGLEFLGADTSKVFNDLSDPLKILKSLSIPTYEVKARGFYINFYELLNRCTDEKLKNTLQDIVERSYLASKLSEGRVSTNVPWYRRLRLREIIVKLTQ